MNNDFNKKILLSILVASVSVAFLAATFMMYAGAVPSTTGNYKLILSGKDNSETVNNTQPPPVVEWENNHPIMIGNRGDYTGAVVAAGTGKTAANNDYYVDQNENYAILLDKTFQWMVPGAKNVLWYEGHGVYEDNEECSNVVDNLESMGYSVTGDNFEPITESELSSYDIVVLPAFQDNLENIDNSEYGALENYVRQDGGLFVSHESDFYGDYYADATDIMNSILQNLGFKWWFNDDTVEDPVNNFTGQPAGSYGPTINVNTSTTIGDNYQSEIGSDNLGVYSVNSLRQATKVAYGVSTDPLYKNALPGSSVTFSVTVTNLSDFDPDNLELWVEDNLGWTENAKLGENYFANVPEKGGTRTTTLTVDVPANENYRVQDNITLTVSSPDNDLERLTTVSVYTSTWTKPPRSDALVQSGNKSGKYGATYYAYVGADAGGGYGDERTYIKWDLSEGVPSGTIDNARLWLYEDYTSGTVGRDIALHRVENDNWSEEIITWNNQPGYDNLISKQPTENGGWLGWNVSDYISDEKASGENIVSFCLKADNEKPATGDNFSTSIVPKDDTGNRYEHPFLAFGPRPVASYATENDYGGPGDNLTVDVVINNRGAVVDNYSVVIDTDNDAWKINVGGSLVENLVENWKTNDNLKNIGPGENAVLPVTVNIPSDASLLDNVSIEFTVTSQQENEYSSSTTDFGVRAGRSASVELIADWNLVSFSVVNESTTRTSLFKETDLYATDVTMNKMVGGGFSGVDLGEQIQDNLGYFIKSPQPVTLTVAGVPELSENISLIADWNLVSFSVVNESTTRTSLFKETDLYATDVTMNKMVGGGFDGVDLGEQIQDNLGYFIKSPQPVTLSCP